MASIFDSSIQPWLDFKVKDNLNFTTEMIPSTIPSCQLEDQMANSVNLTNCTKICTLPVWLLNNDLPNNLLTCGLFATLAFNLKSLDAEYDPKHPPSDLAAIHEQYQDILGRFDILGLDAGDEARVSSIIEAVSTALFTLLKISSAYTYQGDLIQGICSQQCLFPTFGTLSADVPQNVRDCVSVICAPKSLNPDLGGIGVSTRSFTIIGS